MAPKNTKSSASVPATVPATVPASEVPAIVEAVEVVEAVAVVEVDLATRFETVSKTLASVLTYVRELQSTVKALQKDTAKAIKTASAKKGRKAVVGGDKKPRAPSGFAKPTPLSVELCAFLNVPDGTELARTEVTRRINEYIKTNNLQKPEDKRTIIPDAPLQKLMNVVKDTKLTYFNLQSHMKHHFIKAA